MFEISGFYYFPDVFDFTSISDMINKGEWFNVNINNPGSRKVQQFSTGYDYQTSKLVHNNIKPIPEYFITFS